MSAKRYKASTYDTSRPRPAPPATLRRPYNSTTTSHVSNSSDAADLALPPLRLFSAEHDAILTLVHAVELQLHRQGGRCAVAQCYAMLAKTPGLVVPRSSEAQTYRAILTTPSHDDATSQPLHQQQTDTDKRVLLYKFLYVTCAVGLHRLELRSSSNNNNGNSSQMRPAKWWIAKGTDGKLHRVRQACTALSSPSHPSDSICPRPRLKAGNEAHLRQAIQSLSSAHVDLAATNAAAATTSNTTVTTAQQQKQPQARGPCHDTTPSVTPPSGASGTGTTATTTVEDRIRAKHEARRQREAQQDEQARGTSSLSSSSQRRDDFDAQERVRVADLLWSHIQKYVRETIRWGPSRKRPRNSVTDNTPTEEEEEEQPQAPPPHSLTVQDAVHHLLRHQPPLGTPGVRRWKKMDVVQYLRALCHYVPEWIRRTSSSAVAASSSSLSREGADKNNDEWLPDDTLWIYPHHEYAAIRTRILSGTPPPVQAAPAMTTTATITPLSGPAMAKKNPVQRVLPQTQPTADGSSSKSNHSNSTLSSSQLKKRPLAALLSVVRGQALVQSAQQQINATTTPARKPTALPPVRAPDTTDTVVPPVVQTSDSLASVSSPPPRTAKMTTPRLRVNPFLIWTDADYQGGERIVPSSTDSPRGLKSLFHQLNAGKRI